MAAGWRPTAWVALAAGIALCFDTKRVSLGVNLRFVPTRQMREVTRVRGGARIAKVKRNATIKVRKRKKPKTLEELTELKILDEMGNKSMSRKQKDRHKNLLDMMIRQKTNTPKYASLEKVNKKSVDRVMHVLKREKERGIKPGDEVDIESEDPEHAKKQGVVEACYKNSVAVRVKSKKGDSYVLDAKIHRVFRKFQDDESAFTVDIPIFSDSEKTVTEFKSLTQLPTSEESEESKNISKILRKFLLPPPSSSMPPGSSPPRDTYDLEGTPPSPGESEEGGGGRRKKKNRARDLEDILKDTGNVGEFDENGHMFASKRTRRKLPYLLAQLKRRLVKHIGQNRLKRLLNTPLPRLPDLRQNYDNNITINNSSGQLGRLRDIRVERAREIRKLEDNLKNLTKFAEELEQQKRDRKMKRKKNEEKREKKDSTSESSIPLGHRDDHSRSEDPQEDQEDSRQTPADVEMSEVRNGHVPVDPEMTEYFKKYSEYSLETPDPRPSEVKLRFLTSESLGFKFSSTYVESVKEGGQAESLGVRDGWEIASVGGNPVDPGIRARDLFEAISTAKRKSRDFLEISFRIPAGIPGGSSSPGGDEQVYSRGASGQPLPRVP